jgi:alginate O-acetyltransferase complex protein AlgI
MVTVARSIVVPRRLGLYAWLPLAILPASVLLVGGEWPAWVWMWALAIALYAGFKWLTYADCAAAGHATPGRALAYLFLWPGMDAADFFAERTKASAIAAAEWLGAAAKLGSGLLLIYAAARVVGSLPPLAAGWVGMAGLVLALHFGLFHLLSLTWRRAGIEAEPIMDLPTGARSLSDFWGRRWNRAFRDLSHRYVYAPLYPRLGVAGATLAVFVFSGAVHELVISVPARGGWGMPTAYCLFDGLALLAERSRLGRRIGLKRDPAGRWLAAAVVVLPLPLLFHAPFVERVIVPMLSYIGELP